MKAQGSDRRRGMALVIVLWTIALLSALAMAASATFREFAALIAIDHDKVKADGLIEAGLEFTADLVSKLGEHPLAERETVVTLAAGRIDMHISDEGGRININKAPVPVLAALLRFAGASDHAEPLARAIDAWRRKMTSDASASASQPAAIPLTAQRQADAEPTVKNEPLPFTDVRQLRDIPGITDEEIEAIVPLATVYGDDKVNVLTASAAVLSALPGMNSARRDAVIAARQSGPIADDRIKQILGPASEYVKSKARPIALVQMRVKVADGYGSTARAVLVAVPGDREPYRILEWTPAPVPGRSPVVLAEQP